MNVELLVILIAANFITTIVLLSRLKDLNHKFELDKQSNENKFLIIEENRTKDYWDICKIKALYETREGNLL